MTPSLIQASSDRCFTHRLSSPFHFFKRLWESCLWHQTLQMVPHRRPRRKAKQSQRRREIKRKNLKQKETRKRHLRTRLPCSVASTPPALPPIPKSLSPCFCKLSWRVRRSATRGSSQLWPTWASLIKKHASRHSTATMAT